MSRYSTKPPLSTSLVNTVGQTRDHIRQYHVSLSLSHTQFQAVRCLLKIDVRELACFCSLLPHEIRRRIPGYKFEHRTFAFIRPPVDNYRSHILTENHNTLYFFFTKPKVNKKIYFSWQILTVSFFLDIRAMDDLMDRFDITCLWKILH